MSAAAALMRERAAACRHSADGATIWRPGPPDSYGNKPTVVVDLPGDPEPYMVAAGSSDEDTEHIASWHPAVALAVADLIECPCQHHADALSRVYLEGVVS